MAMAVSLGAAATDCATLGGKGKCGMRGAELSPLQSGTYDSRPR